HEVGGELNTFEIAVNGLGNELSCQGLGHSRQTFDQRVPTGKDRNQQHIDHPVLAQDHFFDLITHSIHSDLQCCKVYPIFKLGHKSIYVLQFVHSIWAFCLKSSIVLFMVFTSSM